MASNSSKRNSRSKMYRLSTSSKAARLVHPRYGLVWRNSFSHPRKQVTRQFEDTLASIALAGIVTFSIAHTAISEHCPDQSGPLVTFGWADRRCFRYDRHGASDRTSVLLITSS